MKQSFTQLLSLAALLLLGTTAHAQDPVVLWPTTPEEVANSEFDGGLNDWMTPAGTSQGVENDAAVWTYTATGSGDAGAYYGTRGPILSPSQANGAAMFNSDFLDNAGVAGQDALGTGAAPAPQVAELISPAINMTGITGITLVFNQYYRNFDSSTSVSYSNDGGTTWSDPIPVNADEDGETIPEDVALVYLPSDAGDSENFHVKFTFSGDYYFWIIDDVTLIETPRTDLEMSTWLYPFLSWGTPKDHISVDTVLPFATVINIGADAQSNFTTFFEVRQIVDNSLDAVIYADSVTFTETIAQGDTAEIQFVNRFAPEDFNVDRYAFVYSVVPDTTGGSVEASPGDNVHIGTFAITDSLFRKDGDNAGFGGFRPGSGGDYVVGNDYLISPLSPVQYEADSVFAAVRINDSEYPDGIPDQDFGVYLLKIIPEEFVFEGENSEWFNNPGLEIIGEALINFSVAPEGTLLGAPFTNQVDPGSPIMLEQGTEYRVLIPYTDNLANVFQAYGNVVEYGEFNNPSPLYSGGQWFAGFNGSPAAIIRFQITEAMEVNAPVLDVANKFEVTPNPASDFVRINLELVEVAERAAISLTNLNGVLIDQKVYSNLQQETTTFDVSALAAGNYFVRLITDAGVRVEKITIVK